MLPQGSASACAPGRVASAPPNAWMVIAWRTWKLRRKAIGSNDAEVQSILEAEDLNFRARLLWTEIHGGDRTNLTTAAEQQVLLIRGILCRGGYDAVELNESPLLGLSNLRSALQAFQLRGNLKRVGCDYDLADALTKKRAEERRLGLQKFLSKRHWCIAYDPSFTAAPTTPERMA